MALETLSQQLRLIFLKQPSIKILLLSVPFALFGSIFNYTDAISFIINFIAIIPLAALLGDFTEELAEYSNEVIGALLNVTFGNATELIISIQALRRGMIKLIKLSLVGSILGNMLLVLGTTFLIGGFKKKGHIMTFNSNAVNIYSSLLMLSMLSFVIPCAYTNGLITNQDQYAKATILYSSRLIAILLIIVYIGYLLFQLCTHKYLFDDASNDTSNDTISSDTSDIKRKKLSAPLEFVTTGYGSVEQRKTKDESNALEEEIEEEEAHLFFSVALIGLAVVSVLISILSDNLVNSIEGAAHTMSLSPDFIGIILIPIIGNVVEHVSAIIMAVKDKMDCAVGISLGSSVQVAIFIMPLLVVIAWYLGIPLDLNFHPFLTVVMTASVIVVNNIIYNGSSNWFEGMMLFAAYCMIAIIFAAGHIMKF
jgi:Ca2+:H+ antiporter